MSDFKLYPDERFVFPENSALQYPPELERARRYLAHLAVTADLGLGMRRYSLRFWNNFLYFTEAPQTRRCPVWSCLAPLDKTSELGLAWLAQPDTLVEWWEQEVLAGRFGLVQASQRNKEGDGGEAVVLWGPDGVGQYRTWWDDRDGVPFQWPAGEFSSIATLLNVRLEPYRNSDWEQRLELLRFESERSRGRELLSEEENQAWCLMPQGQWMDDLLGEQEILPRHCKPRPLSWRKGDEVELKRLATSIIHLDADTWAEVPQVQGLVGSASPFFGANVAFLDPRPFQQFATLPGFRTMGEILLELLARDYDPVGWFWSDEEGTGPLSSLGRWDCENYQWTWTVTPPSHHDKVEALLALRDWLVVLRDDGTISEANYTLFINGPKPLSREEYKILSTQINPPLLEEE